METVRQFWVFITGSAQVVVRGGWGYYAWIALLMALIVVGVAAYAQQVAYGMVVTNMRDQISWGFYIGNFAFLVGVAAAAVVIVVPAYVYQWGPLKEVVLLAELVAVSAIVMCIMFVTVDVGRPERLWHLVPLLGAPNFPYSLLVWDILVLNAYLVINFFIVTYLVFKSYTGQAYNANFILPIIFLSIPLAIAIHTVTAFLFMGLAARPFWNTAILAPRFLASAFCSGPALLVLVFLVLRRVTPIAIPDSALRKIGEFLAYAMAINLFLLGCEVFADFYAHTAHVVHAEFQWFGLTDGHGIAAYTWFALACNSAALVIFLVPGLRNRIGLLATACGLAVAGVYIEKGLGLLLPGLTPDMLGEVYAYAPALYEILIGAGIWGVGALLFTLMVKVALAIDVGTFRYRES
jgi:Ni/Fe-hydrogenase subunit HybB-like protein